MAVAAGAQLGGERLDARVRVATVLLIASVAILLGEPNEKESADMIARIWRGRTPEALADEYLELLKRKGVALYRRTPGNRGIHLLRRSKDGVTEFLLLTFWDSLENVRPISGPDPERAHYFPEDERFLLELEPCVQHFEAWQG